MKYRIVKGSGAKCRMDNRCPNWIGHPTHSWRGKAVIKRGDYALVRDQGGFICKDCVATYINETYAELVEILKQVIAEGHAEMTEKIIWSLGGDHEELLGEKKK